MKLATYKDGSRDGQLVVVSRDLAQAHNATSIASRLQQVLGVGSMHSVHQLLVRDRFRHDQRQVTLDWQLLGQRLRLFQTGHLYQYAFMMIIGVFVLLTYWFNRG